MKIMANEILAAGTAMSNVFYNLSQQVGIILKEEECATFKKLYQQWDATLRMPTSTPIQFEERTDEKSMNFLSMMDKMINTGLPWVTDAAKTLITYYEGTEPGAYLKFLNNENEASSNSDNISTTK